ncbi:hypothetical protein M0R45_037129 [Rubus argutus]|uniref:Uncharacterized protein n=1 Tax=Rubus argutus TaxID=59490 RepID=A0AAW1W238_RUBAR
MRRPECTNLDEQKSIGAKDWGQKIRVLHGSSSLTSLEFEFFEDEDNRSSMQKPTSVKSKRGRCLQNVRALKKTDASFLMRAKFKCVHQQERILKEVLISSQRQLAAGSGKFISTASLKPPKIFSCVNHSSTAYNQRSSLGGNYVKMGTAKAAPGKEESQEC